MKKEQVAKEVPGNYTDRMKKIQFTAMVAVVLLFSAALAAGAAPLEVVVSILPQKWLAEQIGDKFVRVHVLVDKGQEPHIFSPTPKQIATLSRASLYLTMDMEFEREIIRRLKSSAPGLQFINSVAGIHKIALSGVGQEKNGSVVADKALDPHVWLDPDNLLRMAEVMAAAMGEADPSHKENYDRNLARVSGQIDRLKSDLDASLAPCRETTFFVFHPAFGYFAHAFGMRQKAVEVEGKSPGPKQLRALIRKARAEHARAIFVQPQFDPRSAGVVAQAIGGKVVSIDPLAEDVTGNLRIMAEKIGSVCNGQD
ncbi:MAG: ABC transporter substrate-binding protein [Desulfobulbus sp.]|nr:MAG: ABC transporter substrate-binding protein [Desulfobulbus sp.]